MHELNLEEVDNVSGAGAPVVVVAVVAVVCVAVFVAGVVNGWSDEKNKQKGK